MASLILAGLGVAAALAPLPQRSAKLADQPLSALPAPAPADNLPASLDYEPAPPAPREPEPAPPEVIIDAPFRAFNPIPMVSVYVDAENKPFTDTQLNTLFRLLDAEIGNQYADRFYYMDALRDNVRGFRDTYEAGGFILKDAPHEAKAAPKRRDGVEAVNTVDVAMALDILERALLGPQGQKIILVTADRDYFPLLIRLKRLGHRVQIWARQPPPRFKTFCQGMGFPLKDLDQEPLLRKEQTARKKR